MSDQEKDSEGTPVVLVEQPAVSRHKPIRPTEMQDSTELHKRSRAPSIPSAVAEDLKDKVDCDTKERQECDRDISPEKQKHSVIKKLPSKSRRASSPESITLATIELNKRSSVPPQPIPAKVTSVTSPKPSPKKTLEKTDDSDSITDEVAESRTPEVAKKSSAWSTEEEAGGLPRSESRASRVSRAVRQMLCCGVRVGAPSEHDISPRPYDGI